MKKCEIRKEQHITLRIMGVVIISAIAVITALVLVLNSSKKVELKMRLPQGEIKISTGQTLPDSSASGP